MDSQAPVRLLSPVKLNKTGPYLEAAEIIREYDFERIIALMN